MTKTVKVRILVAVDPAGVWSSHGYSGADDLVLRDFIAVDYLDVGHAYHWITAEVPIPEATDIMGVVE